MGKKCSFWRGFARVNSNNLGELWGPVTHLTGAGRMSIHREKSGRIVAYAVGMEDVELTRETVKSIELVETNVSFDGIGECNVYDLEMRDGETGTLRLRITTERWVLEGIAEYPPRK